MFNNKLSLILEMIVAFIFSIIYYKLELFFVDDINDILLKNSIFHTIFYYFFIILGFITLSKAALFVYIKESNWIILITTIFGIYLFISAFNFNYYFFVYFFIMVFIYYYLVTNENLIKL